MTAGQATGFESDVWELDHVAEDFSQAANVAAQNPDKLKELQAAFESEARKYNVYPLDDRFAQRVDPTQRPNPLTGLTSFTCTVPASVTSARTPRPARTTCRSRSRRKSMPARVRATASSPPWAEARPDGRST